MKNIIKTFVWCFGLTIKKYIVIKMKEDCNIYDAPIGGLIENEYHEKWVKVSSKNKGYIDAENAIKKARKQFKINLMSVVEVDDGQHFIALYSGGLNGEAWYKKWKAYLEDIGKLIDAFEHAWLIDLTNDCCDDVWYLTIGFNYK